MTIEKLKDFLNDMADEVTPTTVHEGAIERSRRATTRNVVVASVATLALVGGGGVVGFTAVADGGTGQATVTSAPDVRKLEGTFYAGGGGERDDALLSWRPGDDEPREVIPPGTDDGLYTHTGTVAPDGGHVAYLTTPSDEGGSGDDSDRIKARDLDSGKITDLARYSGFGRTCSEPVWTPDSERVLIDRGDEFDERVGFVDVGTGDFTAVPAKSPCDLRVDDRDRVYSTAEDDDGGIEVFRTDPDGKISTIGAAAVAKAEDRHIRELVAVSPDGRYLCVNTNTQAGDYDETLNGRFNYCDLVIDTEARAAIELDGVGEDDLVMASPSVFTVPGRLVVAVAPATGAMTQRLYDHDGELIDEVDSLTSAADEPVLGFVPD